MSNGATTNVLVGTQQPLDAKTFCNNVATLLLLGADNYKAFLYHDKLVVTCREENKDFQWREVIVGEPLGLLPINFTYPVGTIADNIDYSNKSYNFYELASRKKLKNVGIGNHLFLDTYPNAAIDAMGDIVSNSLNIFATSTGLQIENPAASTIQAIYIGNYTPTYDDWIRDGGNLSTNPTFLYKGKGTLAQPYTHSINYTSITAFNIIADSAIQNGLVGYKGTGTRILPEFGSHKIIILFSLNGYIHAQDFNYGSLWLVFQSNVLSTKVAYVQDLDDPTAFNQTTSFTTFEFLPNCVLDVEGDGFNNSGNNVSTTNYASGKIMRFFGSGVNIRSSANTLTKPLFNGDRDSLANGGAGCNNDGNLAFEVRCDVQADLRPVYGIGGLTKLDCYGSFTSGKLNNFVNPTLEAFYQTGGQVRVFATGALNFYGTTRYNAISFNILPGKPLPIFIGVGATFRGVADVLFNKVGAYNSVLEVSSCNSSYALGITDVFNSTTYWPVSFKNNIIARGKIDLAKVDLTGGNTYSASNIIQDSIIECLVVFGSKTEAQLSGLKKGAIFTRRIIRNSGNLESGTEYQIATLGNTNFFSAGAAYPPYEGQYFIATASSSGTGTVHLDTRSKV